MSAVSVKSPSQDFIDRVNDYLASSIGNRSELVSEAAGFLERPAIRATAIWAKLSAAIEALGIDPSTGRSMVAREVSLVASATTSSRRPPSPPIPAMYGSAAHLDEKQSGPAAAAPPMLAAAAASPSPTLPVLRSTIPPALPASKGFKDQFYSTVAKLRKEAPTVLRKVGSDLLAFAKKHPVESVLYTALVGACVYYEGFGISAAVATGLSYLHSQTLDKPKPKAPILPVPIAGSPPPSAGAIRAPIPAAGLTFAPAAAAAFVPDAGGDADLRRAMALSIGDLKVGDGSQFDEKGEPLNAGSGGMSLLYPAPPMGAYAAGLPQNDDADPELQRVLATSLVETRGAPTPVPAASASGSGGAAPSRGSATTAAAASAAPARLPDSDDEGDTDGDGWGAARLAPMIPARPLGTDLKRREPDFNDPRVQFTAQTLAAQRMSSATGQHRAELQSAIDASAAAAAKKD
jgi:hypothetical protein